MLIFFKVQTDFVVLLGSPPPPPFGTSPYSKKLSHFKVKITIAQLITITAAIKKKKFSQILQAQKS